MSGDVAAVGDAVTGMALAHAVDPPPGSGAHDLPALCLNCGTRLIGAHCHACGQAGDVHRTVGAIGHEIAHGVFHFEGRIWRTLPLLVLHPGELTRRYIAGERARFVSPLALFLFTVFLMFAVYSWVGPGDLGVDLGQQAGNVSRGLDRSSSQTRRALTALRAQRAGEARTGKPTVRTDQRIVAAQTELRQIEEARARLAGRGAGTVNSDWPWLEHAIERARANPGLVAYKVQSSAYKFSWGLIVLSTPFVALLFLWRRRFNLYDHAVFATYSIAFMSLLVIALELALLLHVNEALFWLTALLVPPLHMFAQLKGAYGLSIFSAAWRTAFLVAFAVAILILFVLGLFTLGVAH